MSHHLKTLASFFGFLVTALFFGLLMHGTFAAWTAPTAAPPGLNVAAPINVGGGNQTKTGGSIGSTSELRAPQFTDTTNGYVVNLDGLSQFTDLFIDGGVTLTNFANCNLDTVGGVLTCGSDAEGADQNLFATMNAPSGTNPVADLVADILNFVGLGGITISGDSGSDTLTFTNTRNMFSTFNAPSGTDPVADSGTDTLNFAVSGGGMTITGSSSTDTITLALLSTCGVGQALEWNGAAWACADDDAGSTEDVFRTFNTPSGTDPVADSATDTLNFAVSGGGMTITGSSSTDTITLALLSTCGVGQALEWNGATWACADDDVGSGSLWLSAAPDIYFNTGDVGIGTASPQSKLHVQGTGAEFTLKADAINLNNSGEIIFDEGDGGKQFQIIYDGLTGAGGGRLRFNSSGVADLMTIERGGNVGIGTATPNTRLELFDTNDSLLRLTRSGAVNPTTFRVGTDSAMVIQNDGVDTLFFNNGNVGVGVTPSTNFDVNGTAEFGTNSALRLYTDASNVIIQSSGLGFNFFDTVSGLTRLFIDTAGNVGIGTTTPDVKLHVDGEAIFRIENRIDDTVPVGDIGRMWLRTDL